MAEPLLASVIVAVDDDRRLYRLLSSLFVQTLPARLYEIIVVENGSSRFAAVERTEEPRVRYFRLSERNMAAARNLGLEASRGRFVLLTDADVVVSAQWIERMTEHLSSGRYAAVGGPIGKYEPKTWTQRCGITIVQGQAELSYLPALHLPYVAGANAGFVASAIRAVGGFDKEFVSGNDVDVCYRLGLAGYRIGLAREASVLHEDRSSVGAHFHRFRRYAVYQVLLFARYKHLSQKRAVINAYPVRRFAQALMCLPRAALKFARGDAEPTMRALLQMVEAMGIWCGDIQGSIRYRQLYL
jgi:GT2 family glycosyltransferase